MSSRALRKAQKEREKLELEKRQSPVSDEAEEDDDLVSAPSSKPSAFEMLAQLQDDGEDGDDGDPDQEEEIHEATDIAKEEGPSTTIKPTPSRRPQSGKKAKKGNKSQRQQQQRQQQEDHVTASLDNLDIDSAPGSSSIAARNPNHEAELQVCRLLSIDHNHLLVSNEMRRLFGRAAFEADQEERAAQADAARSSQAEGHIGLAQAVAGRMAVGGPGLSAALRRRNIFAQGKEEWPRKTSNGLTMEVESTSELGIVTYKFVHTKQYQILQQTFDMCVRTMDAQNIVAHGRHNPYHVATLLQLSEIAKQERDHSTSGELLERALFAFGKALVPSFSSNLAQGKARLRYERFENREFFLTVWRYIANISMRGTWRTAFEWTKLLLSLDPQGDHQCVRLVIDQLALRAKQTQTLLDLAQSNIFKERWADLPSIAYSYSLARRLVDNKTASQPASVLLTQAIQKWPWVAATLFEHLGVEKIPPSIWGSTAPTDKDKLHSEVYATFAQDIWKVPDNKAFITEIAAKVQKKDSVSALLQNETAISLDEGRFVILADKPSLIGLLPRSISNRLESMSDPLRPDNSIDEYTTGSNRIGQAAHQGSRTADPRQVMREYPRAFVEILRLVGGIWNRHEGVRETEDEQGELNEPGPEELNARIIEILRAAGMDQVEHVNFAWEFVGIMLEQRGSRFDGPNGERAWLQDNMIQTWLPDDPSDAEQAPEQQTDPLSEDDNATR